MREPIGQLRIVSSVKCGLLQAGIDPKRQSLETLNLLCVKHLSGEQFPA
jgi:hypothetical protein